MSDARVALVTGGAQGFGRAIAFRLAKRGFKVVVADVKVDAGKETAAAIAAEVPNAEAVFVKLDVTSKKEWDEAVAFTVQRFGSLTTLINNAGLGGATYAIETQPLDEWNTMHAVNTTGPFLGCQAASAELHKAGKNGSVVNISSVFALLGGFGNLPAYHSSKSAVLGLTKSVALGWASAGIRVNAVLPGFSATPMLINSFGGDVKAIEATFTPLVPMGRNAEPDEIAKCVEFLATDDSSFVTGTSLVCDGGLSLKA